MAATKTTTKRKPAVKPDTAPGVTHTTINGVPVTINVGDLDDVDVLYQLKDAQNGDVFAALDLIDLLIGEDQRKALVDTVRDPETQRASVTDFTGILEQLFGAIPKS